MLAQLWSYVYSQHNAIYCFSDVQFNFWLIMEYLLPLLHNRGQLHKYKSFWAPPCRDIGCIFTSLNLCHWCLCVCIKLELTTTSYLSLPVFFYLYLCVQCQALAQPPTLNPNWQDRSAKLVWGLSDFPVRSSSDIQKKQEKGEITNNSLCQGSKEQRVITFPLISWTLPLVNSIFPKCERGKIFNRQQGLTARWCVSIHLNVIVRQRGSILSQIQKKTMLFKCKSVKDWVCTYVTGIMQKDQLPYVNWSIKAFQILSI